MLRPFFKGNPIHFKAFVKGESYPCQGLFFREILYILRPCLRRFLSILTPIFDGNPIHVKAFSKGILYILRPLFKGNPIYFKALF